MYSGCSQATMVHDLTGLDGIFLSNPDCLFWITDSTKTFGTTALLSIHYIGTVCS